MSYEQGTPVSGSHQSGHPHLGRTPVSPLNPIEPIENEDFGKDTCQHHYEIEDGNGTADTVHAGDMRCSPCLCGFQDIENEPTSLSSSSTGPAPKPENELTNVPRPSTQIVPNPNVKNCADALEEEEGEEAEA